MGKRLVLFWLRLTVGVQAFGVLAPWEMVSYETFHLNELSSLLYDAGFTRSSLGMAAADIDVLVVATSDLYPAGRGEGHPVSRQGAGCPPGLWLPCSPVKRQGVTWGTIIMDTEAKNALGDKDSIMNQSVTAVYPPPPNPSYLPEKYLLPSLILILNGNY